MRKYLAAFICFTTLLATPLSAQQDDPLCEDLWFARNLIHDRAGYCFSSPLGQAQFDNSDCTTRNATLAPAQAALVARIRQSEAQYSCNLDTNRTWLTYPDELEPYRRMADVPVRDFGATGCIGYRGPVLTLRNGASHAAAAIGQLRPGASITFAHWPLNGWSYVSIYPQGYAPDGPADWGWVAIGEGMPPCDSYAG